MQGGHDQEVDMKVTRVAVALAVAIPLACAAPDSPTAPHSTLTGPTPELGATTAASTALSVTGLSIDVRPSTTQDRIPLHADGVLPVALLGTEEFDVLLMDATSLAFGPEGGPFAAPIHDLGVEGVLADHLKDVNLDGWTDLVTHYRVADLAFESGDESACMVGSSLGGLELMGCAPVVTRP
jgi:hypothetical protein